MDGTAGKDNGSASAVRTEVSGAKEAQIFRRKEHTSKDPRSEVVSAVLAARDRWEKDRDEKDKRSGGMSATSTQDAFDEFNPVIGKLGVTDTSLGIGDTPPIIDIPGKNREPDSDPVRVLTTTDPDGSQRVIAKFDEKDPIPVNGVLDFLGRQINATTDDAERAELARIRDIIDRNSVATDQSPGGSGRPDDVVRQEAKRLAEREGRAYTTDDLREAALRVNNKRILVLPRSTEAEDMAARLKRKDASLTERLQEVANAKQKRDERFAALEQEAAERKAKAAAKAAGEPATDASGKTEESGSDSGDATRAAEVAGNGEKAYPYWRDSETDKGLTVKQVESLYPTEWAEVAKLVESTGEIEGNTTNKPDSEYRKDLLDAVADRLRNPGNYDGGGDAISDMLKAARVNNKAFAKEDNLLMAVEAQAILAGQVNSKEARERLKNLLILNNRRQVGNEVSRENPRARIQGGNQDYFQDKPLGADGKPNPEAIPQAETMPQRDLYSFALIADPLMDVMHHKAGETDATYREKMRELEKKLQRVPDKDKKLPTWTKEQEEAAKQLNTLKTQFYSTAMEAMVTVDQPGYDNGDQAITKMQEIIRDVRNKPLSELVDGYKGVGTADEGSPFDKTEVYKKTGKTRRERINDAFGSNDSRNILMQAIKGGDLMIRRTGMPTTPEATTPPDTIKRKIYVQGPSDEPGKKDTTNPGNGNTVNPAPTGGGDGEQEKGKGPNGEDAPRPAPVPGKEGQDGNQDPNSPQKDIAAPPAAPGERRPEDGQESDKPPVSPNPQEPEKPGGGDQNDEIRGTIVHRTEAASQLTDIHAAESVNAELRLRGFARFTNWIRRIAEVPNRFRRREGAMEYLNNPTRRRLFGQARMDDIARAARAQLDASAAGAVERFSNMSGAQAERLGEEIREVRQGSVLHTQLWDRMMRSMVVDGRTWSPEQIRTTLRDIVNDNPTDPDARAILNAENRYGDRAQEFATDLTNMAKAAREKYLKTALDKDGKLIPEDDRLSAIENVSSKLVYVLGNERAAARETGRGWEESLLYRLNARRRVLREAGPVLAFVGNTLLHPTTIGIATTLAARGWTAPVRIFGKFAAPLSPFTPLAVGSAAAGVAAGVRKWQEANRDYWTVNRDVAFNRRSGGPDARNRRELEAIHDIRNAVTATNLHTGGGADIVTGRDRRSVTAIVADLGSGDAARVTQADHEARSRLAEIILRQEMSANINKNLITFSSAENYGKESSDLTKDENALITNLGIDTSTPTWYTDMQNSLRTEIDSWNAHLEPAQTTANRRMRNYRLRRTATAAAISAGTGFVGGILAQKVVSGVRAFAEEVRTGKPQYVGPTLFDRMGKGALEQAEKINHTDLGRWVDQRVDLPREVADAKDRTAQWIDNKFSVPASIDEFKAAFTSGQDVTLPNGMRVHPDGLVVANERHLWLLDQQGTPVLDNKGNALNVPMFVRNDGTLVIHGDISKNPDVPASLKQIFNDLPHSFVDSPLEAAMKQALADANAGKPAFFMIPNPVTNQVERVQVMPGGKFWLPSTPHVMGEIQPDGTVKFIGAPGEMKPLHDALQKTGVTVSNATEHDIVPLHDRISALMKTQPGGGEMMSDEGRIKISYAPGADGQMHVVLTDMSSPDKAVEGIVYWSKEVNPTNVPRPGGPRGELANFKFIRSEFEKVSDDFKGHLAEAGFTGRGFNPIPGQPGGITPIPAGYTMPLEGNEIALAAPDTSITSTMQISLPKDMVITPPVVREPWPAIPTPFDPRRELEGYGSPKKAESTMPPPKKAEPEKKTPAQTETPTPAPRESENTKDGKIRVDDLPGELPKELGPLYEGANENHQEAIAKLQAWQNSETGKQADNETKTKVQSRLNYIQLLLNQQQRARTDEATKTEAKTDDKKGEGEAVQKEGEPGKDEEKKEQPRWIQRMRNPIKAFQRLYAQAKASNGMGHA